MNNEHVFNCFRYLSYVTSMCGNEFNSLDDDMEKVELCF